MKKDYIVKIYDYVESTTGVHVVKAVTDYANKSIYAFAKCDPEDEFDIELGKKIATKRLDLKITKLRAKAAAQRAKYCKRILEYHKREAKRMTKALETSEVSFADFKVEINDLETELATMLNNI